MITTWIKKLGCLNQQPEKSYPSLHFSSPHFLPHHVAVLCRHRYPQDPPVQQPGAQRGTVFGATLATVGHDEHRQEQLHAECSGPTGAKWLWRQQRKGGNRGHPKMIQNREMEGWTNKNGGCKPIVMYCAILYRGYRTMGYREFASKQRDLHPWIHAVYVVMFYLGKWGLKPLERGFSFYQPSHHKFSIKKWIICMCCQVFLFGLFNEFSGE